MTQNTSHAVMAQRHEALDSLDNFPTPPWGTRALCEHVLPTAALADCTVWEPACGRGHMLRPLREYFQAGIGTDCHDYGEQVATVSDFLVPGPSTFDGVDWIITNPPFRLAEQFIHEALHRCDVGVAMLCRTVLLESVGRYNDLFSKRPPAIVAVFAERLPIVKGRVDQKASSATSYSWFVWHKHDRFNEDARPRLMWIPPCRKELEMEGDYDV